MPETEKTADRGAQLPTFIYSQEHASTYESLSARVGCLLG